MFEDKNIYEIPMNPDLYEYLNFECNIRLMFYDIRDLLKHLSIFTKRRVWITVTEENIKDVLKYYSIIMNDDEIYMVDDEK